MRSFGVVSVALVLAFVRQSHQAKQIAIDHSKLEELVEMFDLTEAEGVSFVEVESQMAKASPEDVMKGNYEIQCETTCEFKKKGEPFAVHHTPTPAAEGEDADGAESDVGVDLTKLQKQKRRLETILRSSPDNAVLQEKNVDLAVQIGDLLKTMLASVAVPIDHTMNPIELGNALDLAKAQLNKLRDEMTQNTNPKMRAAYQKLQKMVATLEQASADADTQIDSGMDAQINQLQQRLSELQNERKVKNATDPDLDGAITQVQKAIEEKSDASFVPKKECYRVCMNDKQPKDPAVAHATSNTDGNSIQDCVKMCVGVMKKVVHHIARKVGGTN